MVAAQATGRNLISQTIPPADLSHLNEQELRVLYARIMQDLARMGQTAESCPHIAATLRNIEAAILRLKQRRIPRPPKGPGF